MPRLALACLTLLIVAAAGLIVMTTGDLPERVATHFGGNGAPNGWMTRDGYRTFMLVFVTLLPLFVLAMAGWLPRLVPGAVNVPNRQLWMAPERRQASLDFLLAHAAWLGCVMVLFVVAIHKLLLDANAASSPRLPQPQFFVLMVGFVLALLIWIALLLVRFRKRP